MFEESNHRITSTITTIRVYTEFPTTIYNENIIKPCSNRIPKRGKILQDLLPPIRLLVVGPESHRQHPNGQEDHNLRPHRHREARDIGWGILTAENSTAHDPAKRAPTHERRAAKRPLPLPADVVGLVRQHAGDIGVSARGGEEGAEVPGARVAVGPAHDGETDDAEDGVEGDAEAALVVFVAEPAGEDHYHGGEDVGGCDEALGGSGVVA